MIVSAIVAMGKNRVIGKNNAMMWKLPLEMRYFKETTMGHHLISGRKSFEALGKALPGRTMIIVTRDKNYSAKDCLITHSFVQALDLAKNRGENEVFVVGGSEIYTLALPFIQKLYLTEVDYDEDGDAYFPNIDLSGWDEKKIKDEPVSEKNPLAWTTKIYTKLPGNVVLFDHSFFKLLRSIFCFWR